MRSGDYRSKDQLDKLIQQALIDSVADEEPPAHVWERIRARLTQPERRPSVHLTGLALQGALLTLLLMLGSMSVWQEWSGERSEVAPSQASPTASLALPDVDSTEVRIEPAAAVDTAEIALLREYSSLQTRALIVEQLRRRAPGIAVPASDIPPHPGSPQAKALLPESSHETGPAGLPVYAPGPIW